MGVSKNNGTPKSSILIGFSIINHPFWGTIIFGNIHIFQEDPLILNYHGWDEKTNEFLVIQSDLFGMVKWPFKGG